MGVIKVDISMIVQKQIRSWLEACSFWICLDCFMAYTEKERTIEDIN